MSGVTELIPFCHVEQTHTKKGIKERSGGGCDIENRWRRITRKEGEQGSGGSGRANMQRKKANGGSESGSRWRKITGKEGEKESEVEE